MMLNRGGKRGKDGEIGGKEKKGGRDRGEGGWRRIRESNSGIFIHSKLSRLLTTIERTPLYRDPGTEIEKK